ncbi:related to 26S proteasome regulatory subunit RPN10 [Saccharomycodes ludwigii]|uniref:Related to 26S proteasome regulatory subunit RPN10 n=1 Tax=Saccharomycodes ludwigii TaxID=36035 RepID=A0A376B1V1_9ASCO|nr:hypothetical protein SCDLUD_004383 [Saccharomycodes ludwigii]KAH3900064.1 hypothetical protein SCDLUD_004383 [Saccharomycodes ludwigii]SSD58643.1 related to 26S proteasome regulatory subunit RPN10 [Saccharomycodes ludwigii]
MVLEATVLILDNSEYSRNGDFAPTRYEAQLDAISYIFRAKRNSNPENTLALISLAGDNPQVLSTFTSEHGKILSGLNETSIEGEIHVATALQIASLTLKHRQNKNQHQRIILFLCSPVMKESREDLIKLAKKLKKNSIAVDIVNFGETTTNTSLLEEFNEAVNNTNSSEDKSTLLTLAPGPKLLYEHIASSPIILEDSSNSNADGMTMGGGGGGDDFMDFGVDPSVDPELAMALRMSMEEEQARQERLRQQQQQEQQEEPKEEQGKDTKNL